MYFKEKDIELILKESEKGDVMLLFQSRREALNAANEFKGAAGENVSVVADWTIFRTETKNIISFKSVGTICRGMEGRKTKAIIHIPELEYISQQYGGVCTLKQLQNGAGQQGTPELQKRIKELEAENGRLRHEMSYMVNPMAIGDRHEMGG